ncbi:hypothetical protein BV25DRAFT_1994828 [Artomyces pyxidatus]|uniref:Uncharacterized protein n=1 Tax=Artomyces pyxidatus TaxID=48021 RepID=A0ACB8SP50_9AGAM|nr:hypothetical protein BV25DRAFT_1994828 [Artomyces pyxidatus]
MVRYEHASFVLRTLDSEMWPWCGPLTTRCRHRCLQKAPDLVELSSPSPHTPFLTMASTSSPPHEFITKMPAWRVEERERRRKAFAEYFTTVCEQRKPLTTLPRKYQITKDHPDPPTIAFGFLTTRAQLFAYAQRHQLRDESYPDEPLQLDFCLRPTLAYLSDLISEPYLSFIPAFSPTGDVEDAYVVALYTNYTMRALKCCAEDEAEMIQMLQTELETSEPPMWYWDGCNPY